MNCNNNAEYAQTFTGCIYTCEALTTLRLADDDVTENGDNHQRVCRNLSKCKFTVNLYLILDRYIRQITMARVKHIKAYIWQKKSPKTQVPAKQETMLNLKLESKFHRSLKRNVLISFISLE